VESKLPTEFLKNVLKQLGQAEYRAYVNSLTEKPVRWARKIDGKVVPDWFSAIACEIPSTLKVRSDPLWQAGSYYCQERSAMLPVDEFRKNIAVDRKFSRILDACAAPGGKSLQLMELLSSDGSLISNEIISARCKVLMENLERASAWRSSITSLDIEKIGDRCPEIFDLILVDAPCSGEGMFRKDPDTIAQWSRESIEICAGRQFRILKNALRCLSPGGYIIYSTCTLNIFENEKVVDKILKLGDLELIDSTKIWPHKGLGEGHYYAYLRKIGNIQPVNLKSLRQRKKKIPEVLNELINSVEKFQWMNNEGQLLESNNRWYWCSNTLPDLGYRRKGLEVGELKKGFKKSEFRFSQALALSLTAEDLCASSIGVIELNDELVQSYLRGEELVNEKDQKGYILICYKGQGLGWAKATGSRLRNLFPQAWRIN
tara:strand:- start:123 stop:1415 length:1293 start_codon:yes stop_codon:yes gene_type:complete